MAVLMQVIIIELEIGGIIFSCVFNRLVLNA